MQIISVKKTVYHVDKLMLPSVPTLTLSILPFPYTPSPTPYHFPYLSSFLCLKCTMYIVLSAILIRL